jgi:predicted DCC family thiol-disulfide oxidoreductase YuxK
MMSRVVQGWERFWFAPAPTSTLALFRIGFALVVLAWALSLAPSLFAFFSEDGILPAQPDRGAASWGVLGVFSSDAALTALYLAMVAGAVCLLVGFRSRLAALVVFVCIVSLNRRNPWVLNSGDLLLSVLAFYLMLAPSGAALSVDRWLRNRKGFWEFPERSLWSLRLVQVQVSILYVAAVWAKLQGTTWNDGTAVSYAFRIEDLERFPVPDLVTGSLVLVNLLTFGTLAVELALGLLVWNRVLRPWVLLAGVGLHLGIDLAVRVGFFSYAVLVAYIAFIPPETAREWILRLRRAAGRLRRAEGEPVEGAVLLFDSDCGFCRWAVDKVLTWDRRGRLRPVALQAAEADALLPGLEPEVKMASWHLVTPDGRAYSAGAAAAPLLRLLPGGRPAAAVFARFPRTTNRVYRVVARNRDRLGRAAGASCAVDPGRGGP